MSLRHVAATKSRAVHTSGRVAGASSQRSYTQENGAGICLREMLQEDVLTCELTLRGKLVSTNGTLISRLGLWTSLLRYEGSNLFDASYELCMFIFKCQLLKNCVKCASFFSAK